MLEKYEVKDFSLLWFSNFRVGFYFAILLTANKWINLPERSEMMESDFFSFSFECGIWVISEEREKDIVLRQDVSAQSL